MECFGRRAVPFMRVSVHECGLWYNVASMEKLATDIYTFDNLVKK